MGAKHCHFCPLWLGWTEGEIIQFSDPRILSGGGGRVRSSHETLGRSHYSASMSKNKEKEVHRCSHGHSPKISGALIWFI